MFRYTVSSTVSWATRTFTICEVLIHLIVEAMYILIGVIFHHQIIDLKLIAVLVDQSGKFVNISKYAVYYIIFGTVALI